MKGGHRAAIGHPSIGSVGKGRNLGMSGFDEGYSSCRCLKRKATCLNLKVQMTWKHLGFKLSCHLYLNGVYIIGGELHNWSSRQGMTILQLTCFVIWFGQRFSPEAGSMWSWHQLPNRRARKVDEWNLSLLNIRYKLGCVHTTTPVGWILTKTLRGSFIISVLEISKLRFGRVRQLP